MNERQSPRKIADELLIDGLLTSRNQDAEIDRERRIRTLMTSIAEAPPPTPRSWGRWRFASAAMVFLGVLIALLVFDRQLPSAHAELMRSLEDMESRADLSFELEIMPTQRRDDDSAGVGAGHRRLRDGILHISGPRYVITRSLPDGRTIAGGFDGREYWSNVVREVDGESRKRRQPPKLINDVIAELSVDLAAQLRRLRHAYDIGRPSTEVDPDGRDILHFSGTRRTSGRDLARSSTRGQDRRLGPRAASRIDLWLDPETDRIVQLELGGIPLGPERPSVDLRLTAIPSPSLPNDYFERSGHAVVELGGSRPDRKGDFNSKDGNRRRQARPEKPQAGRRDA